MRWCLVLVLLLLAAVQGHRKVIDDDDLGDDDFDDDDEDDDDYVPVKTNAKPKRPIKEAENVIRTGRLVDDAEHIQDHLDGSVEFDAKTATEAEINFHFFQLHDINKDSLLDGLELYYSISHSLVPSYEALEKNKNLNTKAKKQRIKILQSRVMRNVDKILLEDDKNKDGYLSYPEFANARAALQLLKTPS